MTQVPVPTFENVGSLKFTTGLPSVAVVLPLLVTVTVIGELGLPTFTLPKAAGSGAIVRPGLGAPLALYAPIVHPVVPPGRGVEALVFPAVVSFCKVIRFPVAKLLRLAPLPMRIEPVCGTPLELTPRRLLAVPPLDTESQLQMACHPASELTLPLVCPDQLKISLPCPVRLAYPLLFHVPSETEPSMLNA